MGSFQLIRKDYRSLSPSRIYTEKCQEPDRSWTRCVSVSQLSSFRTPLCWITIRSNLLRSSRSRAMSYMGSLSESHLLPLVHRRYFWSLTGITVISQALSKLSPSKSRIAPTGLLVPQLRTVSQHPQIFATSWMKNLGMKTRCGKCLTNLVNASSDHTPSTALPR
jgi:hypothetical protein